MTKEISEIIKEVVEPLLEVKDALLIRKLDNGGTENKVEEYIVCIMEEDFVRFISKHGTISNAVRRVCNSILHSEHKRVKITFDKIAQTTN